MTSIRTSLLARLAVVSAVVAATVVSALPASAQTPPGRSPGAYVSLNPTRILDTRNGTGAPEHVVAGGGTVTLSVAGRGGVPTTGAAAVALNVTVTDARGYGFITVFPAGASKPNASNVNFTAGRTVPNLVIAQLGSSGQVSIYNGSAATVDIFADVNGYYRSGTAATEGAYMPLSPSRLIDTRDTSTVAGHGTLTLTAPGHGGLPSEGVGAVALNVTVVGPSAYGNLTVYPGGSALPATSNLNYSAHQTIANMVVVQAGSGGQIKFYNGSSGPENLLVDVAGYFTSGAPSAAGTLGSLAPQRLLDTRYGIGAARATVGAGKTVSLQVTGDGGIPVTGVSAVILNVTVTSTARAGYIAVYPSGQAAPTASNLNFVSGQTVPNLVEARVGSGGKVTLLNASKGTVNLIADVAGYYLSGSLPVPNTTPGAYIRNEDRTSPDDVLTSAGCAAARTITDTAAHTIVLDTGAQSNSKDELDGQHGVRLTGDSDDDPNRILDSKLVAFVNGYIDGFEQCRSSAATGQVTIAVATNSSGLNFDVYPADDKGRDWADNVVDKLNATTHSKLSVIGADDIEADFDATEAQAAQWEHAYLAATKSDLLFIGAASGCPIELGGTGGSCHPEDNASNVWTEAQLYYLAHGIYRSRMLALPQIYNSDEATQWENIDRTGATTGDRIDFVGALTERGAAGSSGPDASLSPEQGWAWLWQALSTASITNPSAASLPEVVDLGVI